MSIFGLVAGPWTDLLARLRVRHAERDPLVSLLGQKVLGRCVAEIGNGEQGGNNRGPHVRRWGRGREGIAHCAAFIAFQLEEVVAELGPLRPFCARLLALLDHPKWPRWRLSAKALARELAKVGRWVDEPQPGDPVLYERGRDGDWRGHVGIVERVDGQVLTTIEANVGRYPAKVRRFERPIGSNRMIGFVRLP